MQRYQSFVQGQVKGSQGSDFDLDQSVNQSIHQSINKLYLSTVEIKARKLMGPAKKKTIKIQNYHHYHHKISN